MTESEWTTATGLQAMLAFLRDRVPVSERKLRLYACACCRSVGHMLRDERSREAIRVSERYADGTATDDNLAASSWAAEAAVFALDARADDSRHRLEQRLVRAGWTTDEDATGTPSPVLEDAQRAARSAEWSTSGGDQYVQQGERVVQDAHLLRDIFGNPFRPIAFSPEWRTEAVVALAQSTYEERAWDRMGVLADALEDAGADPAFLEHCRGPNEHVRGCWVIDEVLQKS